MADISATQDAFTQNQMTLRRRARRRLVGAIAIALTAVLILPMLFDPEPRPLGPDVDIRIPEPSSPFVAAPVAVPSATPEEDEDEEEPRAQEAEPTLTPPPTTHPGAKPPEATAPAKVEKPAEKKVAEKAAIKPPPLPAPSGAFASHGFYLQLGAFTSESNAKQLLEKVEAAGFKVSMTDSNSQYRVRVGPIPEKDRALDTQAKLKAKGFTSVMLGP